MMRLKLVPLFLMMALATVLGACEKANQDVPAPPVNQGDTPQGGAELNQSEDESAPSIQEEAPAPEAPLTPDGEETSPENSDEQSP
ncbi:hypothetical protein [Acaryochloris marina]|uniref:Lipoprotein n=2 Tax=Acaryochloris TaxID=155977 RepID=A8ZM01_ACAM1|nr:hypothetical protein [Acaryochloris marina]ABW31770.1 hypothetical protein AM1_B0044 [Acaryochloris marina MBIC11017]BDM83033.1 hypothetical protein AM10699_58940 [Acaryochloris marina MBIC10699]